jgi:hypothetical protein
MNLDGFPAPKEGFVITHVLVVTDQDRSREFYRSLLDGQVLLDRDPVIIKVANTWLTLVTGGGPTDDKPGVSLIRVGHTLLAMPRKTTSARLSRRTLASSSAPVLMPSLERRTVVTLSTMIRPGPSRPLI